MGSASRKERKVDVNGGTRPPILRFSREKYWQRRYGWRNTSWYWVREMLETSSKNFGTSLEVFERLRIWSDALRKFNHSQDRITIPCLWLRKHWQEWYNWNRSFHFAKCLQHFSQDLKATRIQSFWGRFSWLKLFKIATSYAISCLLKISSTRDVIHHDMYILKMRLVSFSVKCALPSHLNAESFR